MNSEIHFDPPAVNPKLSSTTRRTDTKIYDEQNKEISYRHFPDCRTKGQSSGDSEVTQELPSTLTQTGALSGGMEEAYRLPMGTTGDQERVPNTHQYASSHGQAAEAVR
ncbi:hypothetical protein AYI70_g11806 [Smittium culicis]|uniref:Uncharacterized protein n=1 Tax=Smittium culicis TaxID=133412 RepID=A0A1R1X098_9FUNG|nr:hypothetical protein AYI70_g11806 [Smittium culicis]